MTADNEQLPAKGRLTFDFNRAVADACKDYPEETKNITFINSSDPDALEQLTQWVASARPEYTRLLFPGSPGITSRSIATLHLRKGGNFAMHDPVSGKKALVVATKMENNPYRMIFSADVAAFKVFNHELGHVLVEGGTPSTIREIKHSLYTSSDVRLRLAQKWETHAEVFAVMRGFQKGYLNRQEAEMLASVHAEQASIDPAHDASKALTSLVTTHKKTNFAALTPQEVKAEAITHARKFTHWWN